MKTTQLLTLSIVTIQVGKLHCR